MAFDFPIERGPFDTENLGRAALVPIRFIERRRDVSAFDFRQRFRHVAVAHVEFHLRFAGGRQIGHQQFIERDLRSMRQYDGSFDHVFQLPDVARPAVSQQLFPGFRRKSVDPPPGSALNFFRKKSARSMEVLRSMSQRGNDDLHDMQTKEQVFAELIGERPFRDRDWWPR